MIKGSNPFFDLDFTKFMDVSKMMTEFKFPTMGEMPNMDFTGLMESQRRNLEALATANARAYEGLQAVMQRQTELIRQTLEESTGMMGDFMRVGTPEEKMARQTEITKLVFEKTVSNLKELTEMLAKSNHEAANVLTERVSESLEELKARMLTTGGKTRSRG